MFTIEAIHGQTVTVRYGILNFKVYVAENGFVEIPKRIWVDKDYRGGLISNVRAAFEAEKKKGITEDEAIITNDAL
jgi:hypothetical protein